MMVLSYAQLEKVCAEVPRKCASPYSGDSVDRDRNDMLRVFTRGDAEGT
jgi:hypothetical protein